MGKKDNGAGRELDPKRLREEWMKTHGEEPDLLDLIPSEVVKDYEDPDVEKFMSEAIDDIESDDDAEEDKRWLRVCRVRCKLCGDVLERTYKSRDEYGGGMMTCKCGMLSLDPSPVLWRINYHQEGSYEILHEIADDVDAVIEDLLRIEKRRREAWEFAHGMSNVDGKKISPEMAGMIEREICGEISTADIKKRLDEKYAKLSKE